MSTARQLVASCEVKRRNKNKFVSNYAKNQHLLALRLIVLFREDTQANLKRLIQLRNSTKPSLPSAAAEETLAKIELAIALTETALADHSLGEEQDKYLAWIMSGKSGEWSIRSGEIVFAEDSDYTLAKLHNA